MGRFRSHLVTRRAAVLGVLPLPALAGGGQRRGDHAAAADEPHHRSAEAAVAERSTEIHALPPMPTPASWAPPLTPEQYLQLQPNEAGQIPILEYHVITKYPENVADFVRLNDDMRADLQWLAERDFTIISMSDLVNNTINIPAGRHPVALTFDDGTSTQLRFLVADDGSPQVSDDGEYMIDPTCAVGIIEEAFAKFPELGKGGHFAPLPFNAFAYPDDREWDLYDYKLRWLARNGYEVGNHTQEHTNLTDITTAELEATIAQPIVEHNELLGSSAPGNASDILTLPFGTFPDYEIHRDQIDLLDQGFTWEGHEIYLRGALLVGANPTASPATTNYDRLQIARIQANASWDYWMDQIDQGNVPLYVSDGDPHTISAPSSVSDILDSDKLANQGVHAVVYDSETGQIISTT